MDEADELQSFIADCEFKTRKILRDSNKRAKDNARTAAAKQRLEKLKEKSAIFSARANTPLAKPKSPHRIATKPGAPLSKPRSPRRLAQTPNDSVKHLVSAPVDEWRDRDKIIHEANETIKSLKTSTRKESKSVKKVKTIIHASLAVSPFCSSKGNVVVPRKVRPRSRCVDTNVGAGDDPLAKGEPAVITRRTIERDFYIMSKKRNDPRRRRRAAERQGEATPALTAAVLRQRHRCDKRLMKAKRKRAARMYKQLRRLQVPGDVEDGARKADGAPDITAGTKGGDDAENTDDTDASESSDEEVNIHAIHHLVERHMEDENSRSCKRSAKLFMTSTFKPDVKEFWAQLQAGGPAGGRRYDKIQKGHLPSTLLHVARDKKGLDIKERSEREGRHHVGHYLCPYAKPHFEKVRLISNEPWETSSSDRTTSQTISISVRCSRNDLGDLVRDIWMCELYDPRNGSARNFTFSNEAVASLTKKVPPATLEIRKVVHHQTEVHEGVDCVFVVQVFANSNGVASIIYRSVGKVTEEFEGVCVEENLLASFKAFEVLHLLKKSNTRSSYESKFWLDSDNGQCLWEPLIEIIRDSTVAGEHLPMKDSYFMRVASSAHDLLLCLRAEPNWTAVGGIEQADGQILRQQASKTQNAPLSMRVFGCSPYSDVVCPGHAPIGERGAWRFLEPYVDESTDSMFPIWPASINVKYPKSLDKSQASAYFHRKALGPQKGDCVVVLTAMSFESPIIAPYCYAVDKGYISPPFSEHELVPGTIPRVHLPTSLLEKPVESRLDKLLPPPVVVLDPGASEDDWKDAPINCDGNFYHCRESNEFDNDGFRAITSARLIKYDDSIPSIVYGISEKAASPNCPATSKILTHVSSQSCTESLSRKRTAADYHYLAESSGEGTLGETCLFVTHTSAYKSVHLSRKSISSYHAQEQFLHATKEADRKRLDLVLKMKAAEELVEERLKERIAKIELSVTAEEKLVHKCDDSVAVELSPAHNSTLPDQKRRIPCDVDLPLTSHKRQERCFDEGDDLEQIANLLLKNQYFLKAMAQKLGVTEDKVMQIDSMSESRSTLEICNQDNHELKAKSDPSNVLAGPSNHLPGIMRIPKLKLNCKRYRDNDVVGARGDGWKRLPRSETVIGDFSLLKRNVETGTGGPKFKKLEEGRNSIAVDALQELPIQCDLQQFAQEPKPLFIPDLTTERLQLARQYRQKKKANRSILSMSQQQSLDEILQIPITDVPEKVTEDTEAKFDADGRSNAPVEEDLRENNIRPIDHAAAAILAVKNHNLPELELILDSEGLSVETRDFHGNTLFILACQQGSKKLAKFLLRRGANMNVQNNGGNTALHYLYEYKHISLAEYLIRKGANDSIKNGVKLTCYEGLAMDT